ncbi:MAG: DNA-3-methyladenine glycosylase 2 family protein [Gammaproteobacteria bacterium]|nr:DNA-3-methyladenine glycosylase 2 family protein [Gammaproteobacteria bacterium]
MSKYKNKLKIFINQYFRSSTGIINSDKNRVPILASRNICHLLIYPVMTATYDKQEFYRAHLARDARFDGKFFVAVKTTKIYCRPVCPARKAKLENLEFFIHAAQAEAKGYRPCRRCQPETSPGSTAWLGSSAIVKRAVRMMDRANLDELSIHSIAEKLGVGERWLRELFQSQVGASPQAILIAKKLDIARNLLDHSTLSITDIAFSAGFQSIRRFNDAFKSRFEKTPSAFRKKSSSAGLQKLELSYRPPYDWHSLMNFFAARMIPTMESATEDCYQRLFIHNETPGWMQVKLADSNKIAVTFKLVQPGNILDFAARIKDMFDLDADPMHIENDLKRDKKLKPFLAQYQGLRIPGCWNGFELAVRAVIGQKISVKGARTILIRLVELCGEKQTFDQSLTLTRFFPTPKNILAADLSTIGLTKAKIHTLKALAQALHDKKLILDGTADYNKTCQQLLAIKGIGPWTVEYIAMRGLKNPDAFPHTDLEIKKKMDRLQLDAEKWSPWRAYAALLLLTLQLEEKS